MNRLLMLAAGVVVCATAAQALGQQATSVQLPTFSYFGIGTSVSVPDRGSAYLGGVNRAQGDLRQFGAPLLPFGNRSMGSSRSASGMSVTAWIHDFEAMDEALLGQSSYYQGYLQARQAPAGAWDHRVAGSAGSSSATAAPSVEDIRQQRLAAQETRASEALTFFERAKKAEAEGKPNVARIYYEMVTRRATGDLKDQALAKLEALRGGKASMADSRP